MVKLDRVKMFAIISKILLSEKILDRYNIKPDTDLDQLSLLYVKVIQTIIKFNLSLINLNRFVSWNNISELILVIDQLF